MGWPWWRLGGRFQRVANNEACSCVVGACWVVTCWWRVLGFWAGTGGAGVAGDRTSMVSMRSSILLVVVVVLAITTTSCSGPGSATSTEPSSTSQQSLETLAPSVVPTEPEMTPPGSSTFPEPGSADDATPAVAVTLPTEEVDYGIYEAAITMGGSTHRGSIEHANFLATCYAEYGLAAEVVGPGEILVTAGVDQVEAQNRAHMECDQRARDAGLIALSVTDIPEPGILELWYRAYVEVAYECLAANGHTPAAPPSVDSWVQNYPNTWFPHQDVPPESELFELCTQDIVMLLVELGERDQASGVTVP